MQRICFTLKLKLDTLDEYAARHEAVWPEMQDALRATGWRNYSLFLGPDGMLIGYLETEDFQAALEGMARLEVNERWQVEMSRYFDLSGSAPDENMRPLREIFHLE